MALDMGKGWFGESHRHSLARQGIKTGRKTRIKSSRVSFSTETIPYKSLPARTRREIILQQLHDKHEKYYEDDRFSSKEDYKPYEDVYDELSEQRNYSTDSEERKVIQKDLTWLRKTLGNPFIKNESRYSIEFIRNPKRLTDFKIESIDKHLKGGEWFAYGDADYESVVVEKGSGQKIIAGKNVTGRYTPVAILTPYKTKFYPEEFAE